MGRPAKIRAVRMSDDLWELIEQEANRERISCAQFLREAAIWRLAYHETKRGTLDLDSFLLRFASVARRARRATPQPVYGQEGAGALPRMRVGEPQPSLRKTPPT